MSDEIIDALQARLAEVEQELAALRQNRPVTRSRMSRRRVAAFGVILAVLVVPGVALAGHQFSDVPTGGFHDDIDWMADYGITTGYDDGTYRPGNPVTRQAMAAFMRRLSSEFEVVSSLVDPGAATLFNHNTPCPSGKRPIAGGGFSASGNLFVTDSFPSATGWDMVWETDNNATIDPGNLIVYVTCAPRL